MLIEKQSEEVTKLKRLVRDKNKSLEGYRRFKLNATRRLDSLTSRYNKLVVRLKESIKARDRAQLSLRVERSKHKKVVARSQEKVKKAQLRTLNHLKAKHKVQRASKLANKKLRKDKWRHIWSRVRAERVKIKAHYKARITEIYKTVRELRTLLKSREATIVRLRRYLSNQKQYTKNERRWKRRHKLTAVKARRERVEIARQKRMMETSLNRKIAKLEQKLKVKPPYRIKTVKQIVEKKVEVIPNDIKLLQRKLSGVGNITNETARLIEYNVRTEEFLRSESLNLEQASSLLIMKDNGSVMANTVPNLNRDKLLNLCNKGFASKQGKDVYFLTALGEDLVKRYLELMRKRGTFVDNNN